MKEVYRHECKGQRNLNLNNLKRPVMAIQLETAHGLDPNTIAKRGQTPLQSPNVE